MKTSKMTHTSPFLLRAAEGLTSEGVRFNTAKREARLNLTKIQVLESLPVSLTECVEFAQQSGYVARDVDLIESRSSMRFHVEQEGPVSRVWRVA